MKPIRIHLGPMPHMLRTIITDLLWAEADMIVVGQSQADQDALRSVRDQGAEVLITHEPAAQGESCLATILASPRLGIVDLSADGRHVAGVTIVPQQLTLGQEGECGLANVIRQMASHLDTPPMPRAGLS
jgi:hypothetical protein